MPTSLLAHITSCATQVGSSSTKVLPFAPPANAVSSRSALVMSNGSLSTTQVRQWGHAQLVTVARSLRYTLTLLRDLEASVYQTVHGVNDLKPSNRLMSKGAIFRRAKRLQTHRSGWLCIIPRTRNSSLCRCASGSLIVCRWSTEEGHHQSLLPAVAAKASYVAQETLIERQD